MSICSPTRQDSFSSEINSGALWRRSPKRRGTLLSSRSIRERCAVQSDLVEGQSAKIRMMSAIDVGVRKPLGIGAGSLSLIAFHAGRRIRPGVGGKCRPLCLFQNERRKTETLGTSSRRLGYVVSENLFHEGVTSIGIPIMNQQGEIIAAITVSTISQRMPSERRDEMRQIGQESGGGMYTAAGRQEESQTSSKAGFVGLRSASRGPRTDGARPIIVNAPRSKLQGTFSRKGFALFFDALVAAVYKMFHVLLN